MGLTEVVAALAAHVEARPFEPDGSYVWRARGDDPIPPAGVRRTEGRAEASDGLGTVVMLASRGACECCGEDAPLRVFEPEQAGYTCTPCYAGQCPACADVE